MPIPAEEIPLPLNASTLSQLLHTIVGNDGFASEFIVSWVDFGVNPLAVSQSISRMGSAVCDIAEETF